MTPSQETKPRRKRIVLKLGSSCAEKAAETGCNGGDFTVASNVVESGVKYAETADIVHSIPFQKWRIHMTYLLVDIRDYYGRPMF
jgi:hypothetical protein